MTLPSFVFFFSLFFSDREMTRNEVTAAHECNGCRTTTVEVMASAGKMAALLKH